MTVICGLITKRTNRITLAVMAAWHHVVAGTATDVAIALLDRFFTDFANSIGGFVGVHGEWRIEVGV